MVIEEKPENTKKILVAELHAFFGSIHTLQDVSLEIYTNEI